MSMILPTKRITEPRSLLGMGAVILASLKRSQDVSRLWENVKRFYMQSDESTTGPQSFTYDWFILSLDFLFILGVIEVQEGVVSKKHSAISVKADTPVFIQQAPQKTANRSAKTNAVGWKEATSERQEVHVQQGH